MENNDLLTAAKQFIPGGVNSPVRAYSGMEIDPVFIKKGEGPYLYDENDNKYIDYVLSWGPLILGHAHPEVISALKNVMENGTSFGAPTVLETELAEIIVGAYPSIDKIRMVNSGTEATMSAVRLARGYTGRDKIIKVRGCYHGHGDSFLVEAGSGLATAGNPSSPGVPESLTSKTITVPFNNIKAVKEAFRKYQDDIAGIIIEPVTGNMGVVSPEKGYLKSLKEITKNNEALLIFDEVITGFRVAFGGAQELYGIKPDLTCLGKIIGGGLPVGAFGGSEKIMNNIAPEGSVYQAGTLSGNPLAVTAGIKTLKILKDYSYKNLAQNTDYLVEGMETISSNKNVKIQFNKVPGMFSQFFTSEKVKNYETAAKSDRKVFNKYFRLMLENGIYLAPSPFESTFLSVAHDQKILDKTLNIYEDVLSKL